MAAVSVKRSINDQYIKNYFKYLNSSSFFNTVVYFAIVMDANKAYCCCCNIIPRRKSEIHGRSGMLKIVPSLH